MWAWWIHEDLAGLEKREIIKVDGGTFTQTSAATGNPSFDHTLDSFQIGKYQVTYELWYTVREWAESEDRGDKKYSFANKGMEGSVTGGGQRPNFNNVGNLITEEGKYEPVTTVNWRDSIIWCNAYSEMSSLKPCYTYNGNVLRVSTNKKLDKDTPDSYTEADLADCDWSANGYRLSSEGEWQYAASNKGATPYNYASGASGPNTDAEACKEVAWYSPNSNMKTQPVGGKRANELGIFDMSGNVYEWCWDWYYSYPSSSENNYRGVFSGDKRVQRGGDWYGFADRLRVGFRNSYECTPDHANFNIGFRIARSVID